MHAFIECVIQENGHNRKSARKRPHGSDSQKEEGDYKTQNSEHPSWNSEHPSWKRLSQRNPTVTITKLRLLNDVQGLSNLEAPGSKNGGLPHQSVAPTTKKTYDSSEDGGQQSDEQIARCNNRRHLSVASSTAVSCIRRYNSKSENSSDSESTERKNRNAKTHKYQHRTSHDESLKIKPRMGFSERNSKSPMSKERRFPQRLAYTHAKNAINSSESELDKCSKSTEKQQNHKKSPASSKKSKVKNHIEAVTESDVEHKREGIGSLQASNESSRRLKSGGSGHSETAPCSDSSTYSDAKQKCVKKKRKMENLRKGND